MDETNAIELKRKGNNLVEAARAIVIVNEDDRRQAAQFVLLCAAHEKTVHDKLDPSIKSANLIDESVS